nr:MAG TPA: hypothetical protein [Caudoviricetes sp.]
MVALVCMSSSRVILSHYPPDTVASGRLRAPYTSVQYR